jgi:hypothetical protein
MVGSNPVRRTGANGLALTAMFRHVPLPKVEKKPDPGLFLPRIGLAGFLPMSRQLIQIDFSPTDIENRLAASLNGELVVLAL